MPKLSPAPLLGIPPTDGQHVTLFLLFPFVTALGIVHSENVLADFHQVYLKQRDLLQGSAFWGLIDTFSPVGEKFPQKPKIETWNRDFQLKQNHE
jgi:hypothetical protein